MIKRTIEISNPAYLKLANNQLEIHQNDALTASIPIEDLALLVMDHPQVTITQRLLVECSRHNVAIINCDNQHLPISITLALYSHSTHTKVLRVQNTISTVRQKQIWKSIVQSKIGEQADTLTRVGVNHKPVQGMIKAVKSGDKTSVEAQAAKRYWRLLFGSEFRRNRESPGTNALLNYGYAVVRAMVARALVGAGMHPAIGLMHRNQYNPFCLADDVMEPLRPWVDERVIKLVNEGFEEVCSESKKSLLGILDQPVMYEHEKTTLMVALGSLAARLKAAYDDTTVNFSYPTRIVIASDS